MKKQQKHVRHLPRNKTIELFGWIGAAAILIDYALLSLNVLTSDSKLYHLIFFFGCAGLALITFRHRAFQSFITNVVFMLLAVIAIVRIVFFA